jgi:hypothetical protein
MPGPETQRACNNCMEGCAASLAECSAAAMAPLAGCIFPPACPAAAAAAGAALGACNLAVFACNARCQILRCCPKLCAFPNPFEPGDGCCDENETCVDRYDANSRHGCCPADQSACGGRCCARGERCCGDSCCPANYFCLEGNICSEFPARSLWPEDATPPRPPIGPAIRHCLRFGFKPCGRTCCPPELECCSVGSNQYCMTSCLH